MAINALIFNNGLHFRTFKSMYMAYIILKASKVPREYNITSRDMIRGKYLLQYIPPWGRYRKVNSWPNQKCFYYQGQVMWTQSRISHWWMQLRMALIIQCLFVIFIMWWPYVRMEQVNSRGRVVFLLSSPFPVASKNILNGILADFGRQTFNLKYLNQMVF